MSGDAPTLRVQLRATPNFTRGRGGNRPLAIVLHTTAGGFEASLRWFASPRSGASAHYVVALDGRVARLVDEADAARHAGRVLRPSSALVEAQTASPNLYTVGIEFEDGGDALRVARPEAQYRSGAALIAAVAHRWGIPLDREHVLGHREVFADKDCPGNLDADRLLAAAAAIDGAGVTQEEAADDEPQPEPAGPLLACLVPVRNGAADVPGFLESAAAFASTVIALDDGSTDETAALLEAGPIVSRVLANAERTSFTGWDDLANRQRLLDAAVEADAQWAVFLDVDERMDAADGAALREFAATDAIPGCAYGFALYRTWDEGVVGDPTWVYRMFAPAPGSALAGERLHFNPVPVEVSRAAWLRTTVRLRHLDSPRRLAARRAKYAEADPEGTFEHGWAELLAEPDEPARPWAPRRPGTPALSPDGLMEPRSEDRGRPRLVCLLPARNAERLLPGYLESVATFADAVIALDDGSTDRTAELLRDADLVERVITNPRRGGYAGWDDAANRQRLLDAALEDDADWVLYLDADERIDLADATALRRLVNEAADRACAYGFRVFRMAGDEQHYDRAGLWVYRLFAPSAGQRLPADRLHFVPVPEEVPRGRWLNTTIRIKHLASLTQADRVARRAKYADADPELRWQADYSALLDGGDVRPWAPRPQGMPLLAGGDVAGAAALDLEALDLDAPALTAVVIARDDAATIERSVRSVVEQECPKPFEVIVVVSGSPETARVVRERVPQARLVELPDAVLPGRARNAGLRLARGDYVSFPGSHVELPAGSLEARLRAHERGFAMVTGSILNGNETPAGWASYFIDHSSALPGRPSGELAGAPAHCSYARDPLLDLGGFPEDLRAGEDTVVNNELFRRGHRAYRERAVTLIHRSPCSTAAKLARHHFRRGRGMGRILLGAHPHGRPRKRRELRAFVSGYARERVSATEARVAEWGPELWPRLQAVRRLVVLAIYASWAGTCTELLRPRRPRKRSTPGDPEQPRDGDQLEPPLTQAADDPGQSRERDAAVAAAPGGGVVHEDDRAAARRP